MFTLLTPYFYDLLNGILVVPTGTLNLGHID